MQFPQALGSSPFNYSDLVIERFEMYFHQIRYVMSLHPERLLEIGPGEHTVSDYLTRKGICVQTFDNDSALYPDYLGDLRDEWPINERFDVVLAAQVFEHVAFLHLDPLLERVYRVLRPGGHAVISLPYSTVRFFPARSLYGRVVSCEGRLMTGIPFSWVQWPVTILRGIYRFLVLRYTWAGSFRFYRIQEPPTDRFDLHHWDLGYLPTTRKIVRKKMERYFDLLEERRFVRLNVVYYVLKARAEVGERNTQNKQS